LWRQKNWPITLNAERKMTHVVNGSSSSAVAPQISGDVNADTETLMRTTTHTIPHKEDGTLSVPMSASYPVNLAVHGTTYNTFTVSGTANVDTIPRATTPTLSASSVTAGQAVTINLPRNVASVTHSIAYAFGGQTGTIITDAGASYAWTVPTSLLSAIPNAFSGTCTLSVTSFAGGVSLGTRSIQLMINVPTSAAPVVSSVAISEVNTSVVPPAWGFYVQGRSALRILTTATAQYGASITGISVAVGVNTYSGADVTSHVLTLAGTNTVSVTVTDSRGQKTTWNGSVNVVAYTMPTISALSANRCNQDGTANDEGTYARITYAATVAPVNNQNSATGVIEYKLSTASTWTQASTFPVIYSVNSSVIISGLNVNNSYDVRMRVTDKYSESTRNAEIPTAATILDFRADGKGLGIGKVSEIPDTLDVGYDARFRKPVTIDSPLTASGGLGNVPRIGVNNAEAAMAVVNAYNADANTTLLPWVLTNVNGPTSDFWYIRTIINVGSPTGAFNTTTNRKQIAYGYQSNAVRYRHYVSGAWSAWGAAT